MSVANSDYEILHPRCVKMSDWDALLFEISKLYATINEDWADASISDMAEFDPWDALRKLQAPHSEAVKTAHE